MAGLSAAAIAAIIGAVVSTVSAGVAAYGQYAAAQQAQEAARYNAQVARNQALQQHYAAEAQARQREDRTRRLLASQRVAAGASGITTEGSPLAVMMDSAAQGAYEAGLIRYGGQVGSEALFGEAGIQSYYGRQNLAAGETRAGATLLSGIGRGATGYAEYRRENPPPPPSSVNPSANTTAQGWGYM